MRGKGFAKIDSHAIKAFIVRNLFVLLLDIRYRIHSQQALTVIN
jgi:hypothetical protein